MSVTTIELGATPPTPTALPESHHIQDGSPWRRRLAATGLASLQALLLASCDPYSPLRCSDADRENPAIRDRCVAEQTHDGNGTGGGTESDTGPEQQSHLTTFGEELTRQTYEGEYIWPAFVFEGGEWNPLMDDGSKFDALKDSMQAAMLSPGESPTAADKAAVACALGAILIDVRQRGMGDPVTPVTPTNVEEEIINAILAGAWPWDLVRDGLEEYRIAAQNGEDHNSIRYRLAANYCHTGGFWVAGQPTFNVDPNSEAAQACGSACEGSKVPLPVGLREE